MPTRPAVRAALLMGLAAWSAAPSLAQGPPPPRAARALGIDLSNVTRGEGVGGAGPVTVTWYTVDSIALGEATARGVRGALGQFAFRQTFGFDATGIVSHAVFRPYALTFDFDGMRLFLER